LVNAPHKIQRPPGIEGRDADVGTSEALDSHQDRPKKTKGFTSKPWLTCEPLSLMVRLAGFEPTTPWFVAKYSIQLSYSREGKHYISIVLFAEV
jgi:hypothetical protein